MHKDFKGGSYPTIGLNRDSGIMRIE